LTDTSLELKLTQDIFLFGEYEYSKTRTSTNPVDAKIDIKHVGFAFRPVEYDWFNALFKYIRLTDDRPKDLNNADGGYVKANSTSDIYASEFALDLPFKFQLVEKYAYKYENALAYDMLGIVETPEKLRALLWVNRLNYRLTPGWELATEYRYLGEKGTLLRTQETGCLVEIARKVTGNVYVGAGYNFTSFNDSLVEDNYKDAKGFYFRLQGRY
jgi:hypothetical protein